MTPGHKHRVLKVKAGGRIERLLTGPVLSVKTRAEAERSRFAYGEMTPDPHRPNEVTRYMLRPLGVLHGLFGVTLGHYDG